MNTRIAVIKSNFNNDITDKLLTSCLNRLEEAHFSSDAIDVFKVPGAVEIPLIAKLCARKKQYAAIICIGAVIQGDTDHYEYVCQQVTYGCQKVAIEETIPVLFGVLTCKHYEDALARTDTKVHSDKGIEVADAAVEMINLIQSRNL